jgi:lipoprotein NlpI
LEAALRNRFVKRLQAAVLFARSRRSLARLDFARAVRQLDRVIALVPDHAFALSNRGCAFLNLGDDVRAFEDASRSIQCNPRNAEPYLNRGLASLKMGEPERAIVDLRAAIVRGRKHAANAYCHIGVAYSMMHDHDRSIIELTRAIELEPKLGALQCERGMSQFYAGAFDLAAADLRRGLARGGKHPTGHHILFCYLAFARQGRDGAAALRTDLRRLKPPVWPVPVGRFYLGELTSDELLAAAGNTEELGEAQFYVGQWFLLQNNKIAAVRAFTAAKRACPPAFVEHMGADAELRRLGMSARAQV